MLWRRCVDPQRLAQEWLTPSLALGSKITIIMVIKEKQSEAIKSIYEGKDVFAWLPTGYGKSLRYQLLLFIFDFQLGRTRAIATERSVALVISPLVSLMVDQVCSLQVHGVCAAIRNSGNTWVSN